MRNKGLTLGAGAVALGLALATTATWAVAKGDDDRRDRMASISEELSGYQEDPAVVSTTGEGRFRARMDGDTISWNLRYSDLEGAVLQAHIHFGGAAQSGGISVFLCSNLGNGPAGTQACPPAPARIEGVIRAVDVIGPAGQGIAPGELDELLEALDEGKTYVNVHSDLYTGGEIRGQLDHNH